MKLSHFFLIVFIVIPKINADSCTPLEEPWTATKIIAAFAFTYIGCTLHGLNKSFQTRFVKTGDIESRPSKNPALTNKVIKGIQYTATLGALTSGAAATLLTKSALDDISSCLK